MNRIHAKTRGLVLGLIALIMTGLVSLVGASRASAAACLTRCTVPTHITTASYTLAQSDSRPYELAHVSGVGFSPGGTLHTEFQDLTTNTGYFGRTTRTADSYGDVAYTTFLGTGTAHLCHSLRAWIFDSNQGRWFSYSFQAVGPAGC